MTSIPRGKSKSGRVWRDPGEKSFNTVAVCSLKPSWKKRQVNRAEKKALKNYVQDLKTAAQEQKDEKKKRREEQIKRRGENEKKAEILQKITNKAKLKRMKKKQLRSIVKR